MPAYRGRGLRLVSKVTRQARFTYNLGGDPLNRNNPEDVPDNINRALLPANKLERLLGNKSLGILVEELGDLVNLFTGLCQGLEHLPLFPLSPLWRIGGKEEPWAMDDLGDPVQEWVPELVLVCDDSVHLSILLELAHRIGGLGPHKVVLVLAAKLRQDLIHGLGSHKGEPGVCAILCELFGKSTKEESTEHRSESRVVWRPGAIGNTPSGEVVWREIGGEETISTDESDGICENGPRDSVARAQTSARDDRFGGFSLEASVQLEVIDLAIEFLCGSSDFLVWVPLQE